MLAMLLLAGGDEPLDLALRLLGRFQVHQVLFRTIPVVRQNLLRTLPRLLLDGFHHRLQLLLVIRRFRHRLPHDQQHLRFYRCLRIVALHQPVGTLHNARLRIGEVVLILVLRLSLLGLSGALPSAAAFSRARCSTIFLAHWILASRVSRRRNSSGNSSPRWLPCRRSSSSSAASACSSSCFTSSRSCSCFSFIRP